MKLKVEISHYVLRKVGEAEAIPRGYGFAWQNPVRDTLIVMPIPLNLIASFARLVYFWLMRAFYPIKIDKLINEAKAEAQREGYRWGYSEGERKGEEKGRELALNQFRSVFDTTLDALKSGVGDKEVLTDEADTDNG